MAPLLAGKPILYERVQGSQRGDAIPAGKYTVEVFMTCRLVTNTTGALIAHRSDDAALRGDEPTGSLPDESRITIDVQPGRRAHLRITPPDDLEETLRAEVARSLGHPEQYHAAQLKRRPVTVEFAGQLDALDLQELSTRPGGPYGTPSNTPGGFGNGGFF
jgi:hypothetical protein